MRQTNTYAVALLLNTVLPAQAQEAPAVSILEVVGAPKLGFSANGMAGFALNGETSDLTLTVSLDKISFDVKVDTIKTGIALRDRHLREKYVKTAQFPLATLTVLRADLPLTEATENAKGTVPGTFTLHGQAQAVTVTYSVTKKNGVFLVEGGFPYNTEKAGIAIPSYLGVTVDPAMKASAKFQVRVKE